jgi:hypothetical protein
MFVTDVVLEVVLVAEAFPAVFAGGLVLWRRHSAVALVHVFAVPKKRSAVLQFKFRSGSDKNSQITICLIIIKVTLFSTVLCKKVVL